MNAVNQSLGRLIRNINDYGIMICFGIKFSEHSNNLSKWIKRNKKEIWLKENNNSYFYQLNTFLKNLRIKFSNKNNFVNNLNNQENNYASIDEFEEDEGDNSEDNDSFHLLK